MDHGDGVQVKKVVKLESSPTHFGRALQGMGGKV